MGAAVEPNHMAVLALEVHGAARGDLLANPLYDEVQCVVLCCEDDADPDGERRFRLALVLDGPGARSVCVGGGCWDPLQKPFSLWLRGGSVPRGCVGVYVLGWRTRVVCTVVRSHALGCHAPHFARTRTQARRAALATSFPTASQYARSPLRLN